MQRKRYQNGSLDQEKRKDGTVVWVYRWRTKDADGKVIRPKKTIGTKGEFPTRTAALRAIEGLRMDVNRQVDQIGSALVSLDEVYAHYCHVELGENSSKRRRTKQVFTQCFSKHIGPQWGKTRLRDIKPTEVERWLKGLELAPGSKQKLRGIMSILFEHAIRYEWASSNPIRSVRQSWGPTKQFAVFSPGQLKALLAELDDPAYTITLVAATTGIRRGELFGLKWEDMAFTVREIEVIRSIVDGFTGEPKIEHRVGRSPFRRRLVKRYNIGAPNRCIRVRAIGSSQVRPHGESSLHGRMQY